MQTCPQCFCGPSEPKGAPLWLCLGCGAFWEETPETPAKTAAEPAAERIQRAWTLEEVQALAKEFERVYGYYPE